MCYSANSATAHVNYTYGMPEFGAGDRIGKNLFKPIRLKHYRQLAWSNLPDQL
jgi:hypothetical protein